MPVTEVVTLPLTAGADTSSNDSSTGKVWQSMCETIARQDKFEGMFFGREVENPNIAQLFINWDSLEAHQKFMNSPEYGPMVSSLDKLRDGDIQLLHYEFPTIGELTPALSAPVTEIATFFLPSRSSAFQDNVDKFSKVLQDKASGVIGVASAWSVEEVEHKNFDAGKKGKALLLAIGWQNVEAHMAFRETEAFKNNVDLLRGEPKGVEMHHVATQKF